MIQSFADPETERLFHTEKSRRFNAIARVALRKLIQMNRARVLQDLAELHSIASTNNGASPFTGQKMVPPRLPLSIIIDTPS